MYARSKTGAGFTIVETMIFLAISALMFVLAINAMSGKQQTTEFNTGVDTLQSDLNQSLSDVADSNYNAFIKNPVIPLAQATTCYANPTGGQPYYTNVSNPALTGTCTLVGEVIAFDTNSYTIYPVIGRNYVTTTSSPLATTIAQTDPAISAAVSDTVSLPFSLSVVTSASSTPTDIAPVSSPATTDGPIGAFAVFSFTSFDNVTASGSSHVEIFGIPDSKLGSSTPSITGITECGLAGQYVCVPTTPTEEQINYSPGLTMCVNSGTNTESALFSIGGQNSPDSTTYQIYSKWGCTN